MGVLQKFEIIDGAPGDTSLLIKRHYRIVDTSNNAPEYFRTRYGIARSMDRLRTIMDDETMSFPVRASFLQDRYRAIWKDMHVQNWKVSCLSISDTFAQRAIAVKCLHRSI